MAAKKLMKGAAAIAIGAAVLMGGAGTFALWSVDQSVAQEGAIQTGDLDLKLGTAKWKLNGADLSGGVGSVKLVPGDVLELTQPVTVTAIGRDLKSQLSLPTENMFGEAPELKKHFTVDMALPSVEWATKAPTAANTYSITAGSAAYGPVDATVTITFDANGREAVDSSVDLAKVAFRLDQVSK